jgi:hypothetical protein
MASRLKRRIPIIFGGSGGATGLSTAASIGRMVRGVLGAASGAASSAYVGSFISGGSGGFTPETADFGLGGTIGDGQSVTITDNQSRFGTKPNGHKPWLYIPNNTDLLLDTNFSRGTAANVLANPTDLTFSTTSPPPNGSGSLRVAANSSGAAPQWTHPRMTEVYSFVHRRFGYDTLHDALSSNHKSFRLHSNFGGTAPPRTSLYHNYANHDETVMNPAVFIENIGGGRWASASAVLNAVTTGWHTAEYEATQSSASGAADALFFHWVNGSKEHNTTNLTTQNSSYTWDYWNRGALSQNSNNVEVAGSYYYYGPWLVEDSRCRIIVSDESSWNTTKNVATTRDFCLPTLWASNSITLTLRQGIHTTLSGKYLYVVKSDGSALKIGRFT